MKKYAFLLLLAAATITSCAKRGTITGGLMDTIPPTLIGSAPANFTTGFKDNNIRLTFDEYVKLKDINKQLIVSPPMKTPPIITPVTASKYINIRIQDTLQPNTTYSFNFGQSIEDNNEGNPYQQFKYVFSTGSYIDSLMLGGRIKDAYSKTPDNFVSVMLYEVNETYTDSVVFKEAPRYITNTLDSLTAFKLDYLKAGTYQLIALKDENGNNKYDPKQDKIGFHKLITIPNDTLYEIELFKEVLPFKALKPSQASGNRIVMGYQGQAKNITATLRNGNDIIPSIVTQLAKKDSVQIWHAPIKTDSLQLSVVRDSYATEFNLKTRAQKADSLSFAPVQSGTLSLRDTFSINASRPLVKIDSTFISIMDKDSIAIPFKTNYDAFNQNLKVDFKKEPVQKYIVTILPGALTDFYEATNDTLIYKLSTKSLSDYGNVRVTLQNVKKFPVIVQLTNAKGEVMASEYSETATYFEFNFLEPSKYTLRVIYDDNKNGEWDAGNFLQKKQSEEVIYDPTSFDLPANWDWIQLFNLP